MKYRQWKKNYKKKHGVNPPLELDKRKQRRLARKMARQINKTLPTAAETLAAAAEILAAALNRWVQSIKPALATLCENAAAAFSNAAAGLREESEAVEMTNILLGIIALELLAIFSKLDKLEERGRENE